MNCTNRRTDSVGEGGLKRHPLQLPYRGNWHLRHREQRVVEAYERWISGVFEGQAAYVTLTLKQGLKRADGTWARINRELVSNQVHWLLRQLDRKVFRSAAGRHNKRLARAVFIEGGEGTDKRQHVHMIIEVPPPDRLRGKSFEQIIKNIWAEADWGWDQARLKPCFYVPGAAGYSFKTGPDAIDVRNCEFPDSG